MIIFWWSYCVQSTGNTTTAFYDNIAWNLLAIFYHHLACHLVETGFLYSMVIFYLSPTGNTIAIVCDHILYVIYQEKWWPYSVIILYVIYEKQNDPILSSNCVSTTGNAITIFCDHILYVIYWKHIGHILSSYCILTTPNRMTTFYDLLHVTYCKHNLHVLWSYSIRHLLEKRWPYSVITLNIIYISIIPITIVNIFWEFVRISHFMLALVQGICLLTSVW